TEGEASILLSDTSGEKGLQMRVLKEGGSGGSKIILGDTRIDIRGDVVDLQGNVSINSSGYSISNGNFNLGSISSSTGTLRANTLTLTANQTLRINDGSEPLDRESGSVLTLINNITGEAEWKPLSKPNEDLFSLS